MVEIEYRINDLLSEWNPLGVPSFIALDEYKCYVPEIIGRIYDIDSLKDYICHILTDKMEFNSQYINNNIEKIDELCKKIIELNK